MLAVLRKLALVLLLAVPGGVSALPPGPPSSWNPECYQRASSAYGVFEFLEKAKLSKKGAYDEAARQIKEANITPTKEALQLLSEVIEIFYQDPKATPEQLADKVYLKCFAKHWSTKI